MADAYRQMTNGELDAALTGVNAVLQNDPKNPAAYVLRGSIYAQQKNWVQADHDYETAQAIAPTHMIIRFDRAELKFMQQAYDAARPAFVELQSDKDLGDLATFKVFLCDLMGHHEDAAAKELDTLNRVGSNPSYYFANATWDFTHHKLEEGRGWLESAARIYGDNPHKLGSYAVSLKNLGFLPLPPPKQ